MSNNRPNGYSDHNTTARRTPTAPPAPVIDDRLNETIARLEKVAVELGTAATVIATQISQPAPAKTTTTRHTVIGAVTFLIMLAALIALVAWIAS